MANKVLLVTVALLLGTVLVLVACGAGGDKAALENRVWVLESYGEPGNPKAVVPDTKVTIEFKSAESNIAGSGGCNRYFGGYEVNKNKLTIKPPIGSTRMACPEPVMDQEQEYFTLLGTTETFKIQNGKLTITCYGNKTLVFTGQ